MWLGAVLLVLVLCVALRREILNLWIRDPSFHDPLPSLADASALLVPHADSVLLVDRPEDIRAFRAAAFSDGPWPSAEPSMVELLGRDGSIAGIGKDGSMTFEVIYHDKPVERWGALVRLIGIGPCLEYNYGHRYFLIGRPWRRWLDHAAATYPHLQEVVVEASAARGLAYVKAIAGEVGLVPSAAFWAGAGVYSDDLLLYVLPVEGSASLTSGFQAAAKQAESQARATLARIFRALFACGCTDDRAHMAHGGWLPFRLTRVGDRVIASTEVRLLLGPNPRENEQSFREASVQKYSVEQFSARQVWLLFREQPSEEKLAALRWRLLDSARGRPKKVAEEAGSE